MFLGKNWKFFISYQGYRDCFVTKCFSQKPQSFSRLISRLFNLRKMHVFSFYVADVTVFQNFLTSLALPLSNPPQPKINFLSTPSFSTKNLCKITSRYVFLNIASIFVLDYAEFRLGFWNLGIFEKGVRVLIFVQIFSKFWLVWVPFAVFVSVLAPWGILCIEANFIMFMHSS